MPLAWIGPGLSELSTTKQHPRIPRDPGEIVEHRFWRLCGRYDGARERLSQHRSHGHDTKAARLFDYPRHLLACILAVAAADQIEGAVDGERETSAGDDTRIDDERRTRGTCGGERF
jgi:hypothetical protein